MNLRAEFKSKNLSNNPFMWVIFLLRAIGRITYKPVFWTLKIVYIGVYTFVTWFEKGSFSKINLSSLFSIKLLFKSIFNFFGLVSESIKRIVVRFLYTIFGVVKRVVFFIGSILIFLIPKRSSSRPFFSSFLKSVYLFFSSLGNLKYKLAFSLKRKKSKKEITVEKTKKRKSVWKPILRFTAISSIILMIVFGAGFYVLILKDLPDPNQLIERERVLSTKIYARDGSLLYKIYRNQNRSLIKLEEIPDHVVNATIAIEDNNFWSHPGFSIRGITRAVRNNLNHTAVQGGSTITQQLVKNALLSPERTYTRKIKELVLAIEVEVLFSKQEILQMYFNEIPYGGVAYGVEEAAQTYFGKSARDLNVSEAALLAGLPSAPTKLSPFGAKPEYAVYRQQQVLKKMLSEGYIDEAEYKKALNTKISLKPPVASIRAPHFVMYVKDLLVEKYGTRMVEEGGLEVYTSLDPDLQTDAELAVADEIDKLIPMRVTNGAALVTNPQTGEVLAMVGSRDYFDTKNDGNVNVALQLRQPGSSIKPVTYALALQSGMTPSSLIVDSPVSYPDGYDDWGRPRFYQPVNYDGVFHGNVTLKTALASSFNIPAVKLVDKVGVQRMIDLAESMGISTWNDRSRFGLSITLGGGEVKMTDMAVVYGVFANQGIKVKLQPILSVRDAEGKILDEFTCQQGLPFLPEAEAKSPDSNTGKVCGTKTVLSPYTAYQITDMLSDNNARIPAFGPNSLLVIPGHNVAVKTGTTNDKRDNWAVGYTPDHVVVVWVGNNDNSPMSAVASGITGATPIWHNIMEAIVADYDNPKNFVPPKGMIPVQVCAANGLLPCKSCPVLKTEYFVPGTEPKAHCSDEVIKKDEDKKEKEV